MNTDNRSTVSLFPTIYKGEKVKEYLGKKSRSILFNPGELVDCLSSCFGGACALIHVHFNVAHHSSVCIWIEKPSESEIKRIYEKRGSPLPKEVTKFH
jgi:hypothetical protein